MSETLAEFSMMTTVPATHPCLPGHFPGRPLVPAVLLLECATKALRAQLGGLRLTAVHGAKFLRPVLPGAAIELQIAADLHAGRARFRLQVQGELAAQGELGFVRI